MIWPRRRFVLSALLGVVWARAALSHRGHQTMSLVDIGVQGEVRITHTLIAHDTEPELLQLAPAAAPTVDDADALHALLVHLSDAFRVNGARGTYLSHELGPDVLTFVYQTKIAVPANAAPLSITIAHSLFPASHTALVGFVNVRYRGVTKGLQFVRGTAPQTVTF